MHLRRKSVASPLVLPLTLAEAKSHLRVDVADDDEVILDMIRAAADMFQDQTWSSMYVQTWELILPCFPGDPEFTRCPCYWAPRKDTIRLPRPPVASVVSVTYIDAGGDQVVIDPGQYALVSAEDGAWLMPSAGAAWPSAMVDAPEPVVIEYLAGYNGTTIPFPAQARQAVRMLIAHWYENREAVVMGTISKEQEIAVAQLARNISFFRF